MSGREELLAPLVSGQLCPTESFIISYNPSKAVVNSMPHCSTILEGGQGIRSRVKQRSRSTVATEHQTTTEEVVHNILAYFIHRYVRPVPNGKQYAAMGSIPCFYTFAVSDVVPRLVWFAVNA
jgi:hypothetical protein